MRLRFLLAPILLVACIAGVSIAMIERASRTTPQRVADWLDATSCAAVSRHRLAMQGADRGFGVERAKAPRLLREYCDRLGGSIREPR